MLEDDADVNERADALHVATLQYHCISQFDEAIELQDVAATNQTPT